MSEELKNVIGLLKKAYDETLPYTGGYSDNFMGIEEFRAALKQATEKLEKEDYGDLIKLLSWFAPTYDWDDFSDNSDLGHDIYVSLQKVESIVKN